MKPYSRARKGTVAGSKRLKLQRRYRGPILGGALVVSLLGAACGSASTSPPPTSPQDPPSDPAPELEPGQSVFGENRYIEYIPGNLPIILSAPHGGDLTPLSIPDRTAQRCDGSATTVKDLNTAELAVAMQEAMFERFGGYPHVVINHLHRRKLDANRERAEAACGNAAASRAWDEYQGFLDLARERVIEEHGRGWFMDIHGHGHEIQRLELGYLLTRAELNQDDAALAADGEAARRSSIYTIVEQSPLDHAALLRGEESLGALYEAHGFPAVPGLSDPKPGDDPFFTGGYNTRRHGCGSAADGLGGRTGGPICGVQLEANRIGVRDTESSRASFAAATAAVLETFLSEHWDLVVAPAGAHAGSSSHERSVP